MQLYLQRPELRGPAPEILLHGEGATTSSICKVRPGQVLLGAASDLCFWARNPDQETERRVLRLGANT